MTGVHEGRDGGGEGINIRRGKIEVKYIAAKIDHYCGMTDMA